MHRKFRGQAVGVLAACVVLPLVGAALAGRDLKPLARFPPPLAVPVDYPRFSWWVVGMVVGAGGLVAGSWAASRSAVRRRLEPRSPPETIVKVGGRGRFPWWGGVAVVWTLAWWGLAWSRLGWFAWGQRYTFTPLWLGFIVVANALTTRGGAAALMVRAPAVWLRLFAGSAMFWWVFEWLNRFVDNWHYLGVAGVGPWEYGIHSTVCFSTVLPAVTAMREWLGTRRRLQTRLEHGPAWRWLLRRRTGTFLIVLGAAGLILTGAEPVYGYPALWAAPLLLGVGWLVRAKAGGWWRGVAEGDWREAGSWALAALGCGCFWELWNWHSLGKWSYTVPFVQRWPVFEMPLLGYTGYLAFGLECALAVRWVAGAAGGGVEAGLPAAVSTPEPSR